MNDRDQRRPQCSRCGAPLSRSVTGTMALSATTLCADCDRSG